MIKTVVINNKSNQRAYFVSSGEWSKIVPINVHSKGKVVTLTTDMPQLTFHLNLRQRGMLNKEFTYIRNESTRLSGKASNKETYHKFFSETKSSL